jgi:hypothetical protein
VTYSNSKQLQHQPEKLERFLKICYNASDALAADRATAFLPIITAQGIFVGALAVAVFKTATITSTSSLFVNVEAHSIAFSALYFWIIPAVFLSSVIGVSQTEGTIPRILKDLRAAFTTDSILEGIELPELDDRKARTVSGGIYAWQPGSNPQGRREPLYKRVWGVVSDKLNWLPLFTVASSTITAMLVSGYVPADGWQPRHCAYATYLIVWILSFLLTNWLKQSQPPVLWTCNFLSSTWSTMLRRLSKRHRHSGYERPAAQSPDKRHTAERYTMFLAAFVKDTIVALGTLGVLLYIQAGPFNNCSAYTLWGRRGLALPGMPEIAAILNQRIRQVYPAIAFTNISIQIFLIPMVVLLWNRKALRVLWQTDDGTSQFPRRWLRNRSTAVGYTRDEGTELVEVASPSAGMREETGESRTSQSRESLSGISDWGEYYRAQVA